LRGRSDEVGDMARQKEIDFCCLQETRWKGKSALVIGGLYTLFWMGCEKGDAGVGIVVAPKWIDRVDRSEVKRVNERIIMVRIMIGKTVVNIVSVYAPQKGRTKKEKEDFYAKLGKVLLGVGSEEKLFICGDMNGHVGQKIDGFEGVHGGYGFGTRNAEGKRLLKFADAMGLVVANTWFAKSEQRKVTYKSGGCRSEVDYVLVKRGERMFVRDVTVVEPCTCIRQHKLVVCVVRYRRM